MRHPSGKSPDLEACAAQNAQVRALARAITREAHLADDLAQDAWVALLRRPPAQPGSLTGWWSGTLRNLLRVRHRSEAHRKQRERAAARPEHEAGSQLALERLELHQAILQAVRELREPYRTTVVLRWLEELDPIEIARRTGVPVRTVHTRAGRALQMLRAKLSGRWDGGGMASGIVLWIAGLTGARSHAWKGALIVQTKSKLVAFGAFAAAASVAFVALPTWTGVGAQVPAAAPDLSAPQVASVRGADEARPAQGPTDSRLEVAPADPPLAPAPSASPSAPAPATRTVIGVAIDALGNPASGVVVEHAPSGHGPAAPASVSRATDISGQFVLAVESEQGTLRTRSRDWTTLYEAQVQAPDPPDGYVLVVARRMSIAGRVVDSAGEPIQGADVTYDRAGVMYVDWGSGGHFRHMRSILRDPLVAALPYALEPSSPVDWWASTDEDGRFGLDDTPDLADSKLVARKEGYLQCSQILGRETEDVLLVLQRPNEVPGLLCGRVVDAERRPMSDTAVMLGSILAWTDAAGRFALDVHSAGDASRLIAVKEGWEPALEICRGSSAADVSAWPAPLELTLRKRGPVLRGRVVDIRGKPRAGAQVFLLDPCQHSEVFAWAGETSALDAGLLARVVSGGHPKETDAEGRFELSGILPRGHRIGVFDRSTLAFAETEPIPPGSGEILIQLGSEQRITRHAGRVVDFAGRPVSGCKVSLRRSLEGGEHAGGRTFDGAHVISDPKGHFDLGLASAVADTALVQVADEAPWGSVPIPPQADRGSLVLRVGLPGRLQVDLTHSFLEVDTFWVLDAGGQLLNLALSQGAGWTSSARWSAQSRQRTQAMLVSEEAATLVLGARGREVSRTPIKIVPGELVVVRP
jgi:RNA polymerase sigma factor (sigma-70 family)